MTPKIELNEYTKCSIYKSCFERTSAVYELPVEIFVAAVDELYAVVAAVYQPDDDIEELCAHGIKRLSIDAIAERVRHPPMMN